MTQDEALAAWGLVRESAPAEAYELWEELAPAVDLFMRLRTQWRAGPAGLIGLDLAALPHCGARLPRRARKDVLGWLQVMESAALERFAAR